MVFSINNRNGFDVDSMSQFGEIIELGAYTENLPRLNIAFDPRREGIVTYPPLGYRYEMILQIRSAQADLSSLLDHILVYIRSHGAYLHCHYLELYQPDL